MIQIMKPDIRVHVEVRGGFYHKANFAAGRKKSPSCNSKSPVNKPFNIQLFVVSETTPSRKAIISKPLKRLVNKKSLLSRNSLNIYL